MPLTKATFEQATECARLYCRLGTLRLVGECLKISGERVRQILTYGHRQGWICYRPRAARCDAIAKLPEALTVAINFRDLARHLGLSEKRLMYNVRLLRLSLRAITTQLQRNDFETAKRNLLAHATRLGVERTMHSGILQRDADASAALRYFMRQLGSRQRRDHRRIPVSIDEVRRYFKLPVPARPRRSYARRYFGVYRRTEN